MYKLLAIDMDGTLLNSSLEISDENKQAIKKAQEQGVKVVITSGRGLKGLEKHLETLNLLGPNDYVIANNGGTLYETKTGNCIHYKGLSGTDLMQLYKLSLDFNLPIMAYTHQGCIAPEDNEFTQFERAYTGTPVDIIDYNALSLSEEITKVLLRCDPDTIDQTLQSIPAKYNENYHIVKTMPNLIEVMNKDCNKGYGVKFLAEHLGIPKEAIICIGDQANDLEMIAYAGVGIAMENAIPELKEIANYITAHHDLHGVARAIEKFISI